MTSLSEWLFLEYYNIKKKTVKITVVMVKTLSCHHHVYFIGTRSSDLQDGLSNIQAKLEDPALSAQGGR